ncbi:MAG: hypothetical protein GXP54_09395 [Deltaproteobacteria bacterium]|nr:hypothetical protein [Deltaproteobacteria bacterium]
MSCPKWCFAWLLAAVVVNTGCYGGGDEPMVDQGWQPDLNNGDASGDLDAETVSEVPDVAPGSDADAFSDAFNDNGDVEKDAAADDVVVKPELPPQCFADKHCDDEDPCTEDRCNDDKQCVITPMDCDDGNACTKDGCDPVSGCTHQSIPDCVPSNCASDADCIDLNGCTVGEKCQDGACTFEFKKCPDDGKTCTVNVCDPATGECTHYVDCDDDNACTKDWCDPQKDFMCRNSVDKCDDKDDCTQDSCDPEFGCLHTLVTGCSPLCQSDADCDDGNACTDDRCEQGACRNWRMGSCCKRAEDCDDGDPCTFDWCDPPMKGQCQHLPFPGCK